MAARQILDSADLGVRLSTVSSLSLFYNKELLQFANDLFSAAQSKISAHEFDKSYLAIQRYRRTHR